jgi:hypothetical protein
MGPFSISCQIGDLLQKKSDTISLLRDSLMSLMKLSKANLCSSNNSCTFDSVAQHHFSATIVLLVKTLIYSETNENPFDTLRIQRFGL